MYEHYVSDYDSVGPVYFRGPLQQDNHLIIDNRLLWYNMDHEHAMYEHYVSDYDSVAPVYFCGPLQQDSHFIIANRLL